MDLSVASMDAIRVEEHGDLTRLSLSQIPRPTPGPGEVLVEVRAAGLNHLDLWVRRGVPGHRFPLPLVVGCDGAGVVTALGPKIERAKLGDEVIVAPGISCGVCAACSQGNDPLCSKYGILGETRDGLCAEYAVVPEANLIPKPPSVDWAEAGSFALAALTAWTMITDRAQLQPGESILVIAAGSGVGSIAVQIGRFLGCHVIATAGGEKKCAQLPALGADAVIDHRRESISQRVREITDRRGVDVVFEHVGEETWQESLASLAWGGRLVTCGATTGASASIHLRRLFFKNQSILGSTMGPRAHLHRLVKLLERRLIQPMVTHTLPLKEISRAHQLLEAREVFGKVALLPRSLS